MLARYRRFWPLVFMLIYPVLGAIYAIVNKPADKVYNLTTSWDHAIPFVKYFALPYSVWIFYIYVCVIYFFMKDIRVYYRALLTYTICACICYCIYSVFQTTMPRPEVVGNDVFSQLMRFLYNRDEPYNCFPSIHVFSSYMVFRLTVASGFRNRRNLTLIGGMSSLIIASTLFIKQHAIADGVAGIVLVEIVLALILLAERRLFAKSGRRERSRSFEA